VIIRSRKLKKYRHQNGQNKKDIKTSNGRQHTSQQLAKIGELRWSGNISSSCSTSGTRRVTDKQHEHHLLWELCWISVSVKKAKTNRISPLCGNRNGYHKTELKIGKHKFRQMKSRIPLKTGENPDSPEG